MSARPLHLTEQEIEDMTGYHRPAYQMKVLQGLGIPARKRPDNSVLVLRMDCQHRRAPVANDTPKLKSSRK